MRVWFKKPDADDAYVLLKPGLDRTLCLTSDIFDTLRGLKVHLGSGGEIRWLMQLNIHAQQGSVETVRLNGRRFDCGSVDGFLDEIMHRANIKK